MTKFTYNTTTTIATTVPSGRFVKTTADGFGRTKRVETGYGSTTVSGLDAAVDGTQSYNNGQMATLSLPDRTISYTFPAPGLDNGEVASITDSGENKAYQ